MFDTDEAADTGVSLTREPPYEQWAGPIGAPYVNENGSLDVRGTLDRLLATQPGLDVLNIATMLIAVDGALTSDERVDLLIVMARCHAWLDAVTQKLLANVDRDAGEPSRRSDEPG